MRLASGVELWGSLRLTNASWIWVLLLSRLLLGLLRIRRHVLL
jgi:hypothetical protein